MFGKTFRSNREVTSDSLQEKVANTKNLPNYIICGYEQGGTTLMSDMFRANGYESGFECGALLASSPKEFRTVEPFYARLADHWALTGDQVEQAVQGNFEHFYESLVQYSFPDFSGRGFFDKTPAYMKHLGLCLSRTEFFKKAIVIHRDPRAVFCSMAKRIDPNLPISDAVEKHLDNLVKRYMDYYVGSIAHMKNEQVMFVPFEDLCTRPSSWLKALGFFVHSAPFHSIEKESRYENVSGTNITSDKVEEFKKHLSEKQQENILQRTCLAAPFFMNIEEQLQYGDRWGKKLDDVNYVLQRDGLSPTGLYVEGEYFEPMTYLLRYPDVLDNKINPVMHFKNSGKSEGRIPF